ncbi:TAXI family TRAP transporter solute-binding subunit [Zwartia panacis]|jgi:TRAP transporter TAXI family solute receptor|uniref:TAXI family TRAP transporter solute-binding subunit n=1 Tax=Zwartia panacis TaxID=2683345 RepID=UPI0025B29B14|nr:TAXI family TRAP transporter solute-binding subunit [Zwartia panacis]MDN4017338.1 TAXI family TRAP transporter solute-binding subunit [Zwartia panacis]
MKQTTKFALSAVALGTALLATTPASAQQVTLMTGPQGGVWVPLGGALKGMWEKAIPGLQITAQPGAGVANVIGVEQGKAQVGFSNSSSAVDGAMGVPPFKQKSTNVCQMANIYPQYFQVVATASSNINSYADIKGKRLVAQSKGNTAEAITAAVLKLNGFDYSGLARMNFQASYTDAVSMMKDGHVDVFTLGTTAPASAVMDLASGRDIKLVPVDDKTMEGMRKMNGGYSKLIIKAGTYPKQDKDVPVIGYQTHLIVRCDMPEDVVYKMVKTMAENIPAMAAVNKAIGELTPKMMAADAGIPMHPGAAKYFKEVGAM